MHTNIKDSNSKELLKKLSNQDSEILNLVGKTYYKYYVVWLISIQYTYVIFYRL